MICGVAFIGSSFCSSSGAAGYTGATAGCTVYANCQNIFIS
ncbi:hypothetical protein BSTP3_076 [Bacillus phage BSTP3]|nr:hypothetical protein BSTP3_076 [Bacillus phage BSTP3]